MLFALITTAVSLYSIPSCAGHSVVAEYKHLDNNVLKVLFHPQSEEEWDHMLKTVNYYTMKIVNLGLRISTQMETDKKTVNKIVNSGRPKFLNYTLNIKELTEELFIPHEKIQEFYDMCVELERTWVQFVKIAKAMKYQKKTRKPYIVQGAFHGRRLGRKKGRSEPYPHIPQVQNKKTSKTTQEEIDALDLSKLKGYDSKSLEYDDY